MLKVLNTNGRYPESIEVVRTIKCQPGMFAQLNKKGKAKLSDGSGPIGIIDDVKTAIENTICDKRLCIWRGKGIYATDQVEKQGDFLVGRLLYVSRRGKLTTRQRNKAQPHVGIVVSYLGGILEFEYWGSQP